MPVIGFKRPDANDTIQTTTFACNSTTSTVRRPLETFTKGGLGCMLVKNTNIYILHVDYMSKAVS